MPFSTQVGPREVGVTAYSKRIDPTENLLKARDLLPRNSACAYIKVSVSLESGVSQTPEVHCAPLIENPLHQVFLEQQAGGHL